MHFEILVEDPSGKKMLDILVPKIIGDGHTFRVLSYRGIGRIPRGMRDPKDVSKRILLENLPKLLKGYGRAFADYDKDYKAAVIFVCDLDDKCLKIFRAELCAILYKCHPKPETRFCIAIEEGEAWFLGDISAVKAAYSRAMNGVLDAYENENICGTWETLADAVYPGGSSVLANKGWQSIGAEKSKWAENIAPHMNVSSNNSPSFCYFRRKLQELAEAR
jgi:hypothetical protein